MFLSVLVLSVIIRFECVRFECVAVCCWSSNTLKNIGSDLWKHLVGEPHREQGQIGVYLDDQMSDWIVADNRFDGYIRTGIAIGGGRRNRALRNQFENCGTMHHEGTVNQSGGSCVVLDK